MELIDAYKGYEAKIKEQSPMYDTITHNSDSAILSCLFLIKTYRDYILNCDNTGRSPRISSLADISKLQSTSLNNLLQACLSVVDSLQLDVKQVIIKDDNIVDPFMLVDTLLKDYVVLGLSPDSTYEHIIRSVFNIIIEKDFERTLKNIFLKFTHQKDK